eukprot:scaffold19448_cov21-Tisochrysis_lutea.AAC.3
MSVLSEPIHQVLLRGRRMAGFRDMSASLWLPNIKPVPDKVACCTAQQPKLKSPDKRYCLASMPFQGGGCSGRAMLAIFCSDTKHTMLPKSFCLACMPKFRVGGALGRPGEPGARERIWLPSAFRNLGLKYQYLSFVSLFFHYA